MVVTLRYFDGCPNWRVANQRLKEALRLTGRENEEILLERVESPEEADRVRFRGSPTILIDGKDPFADGTAPYGLSCRVYRTDRGLEGSPSIEQLKGCLSRRQRPDGS
jgi:hypothetical protein